MRYLPVLLVLAACGNAVPDAPRDPRVAAAEAACAPAVNADPAVHDLMIKGAGNEHFKYEHDDDLKQARQQALQSCMRGQGAGTSSGGVERQRRS